MSAQHQSKLKALCLASLGIVYGDIGTSPLYAFRECFMEEHGLALNTANVYGVLSLIFWALICVISVKYIVFILQADNKGEGGELALSALCLQVPSQNLKVRNALIALGLVGASLLYGDGMITPAISVLSAVEGLKVATPFFEPYIIPITIVILIGLFSIQKGGTAKIGKIFGPIMVVWFSTLGLLGLFSVVKNPQVFEAINPRYAIEYFANNGMSAFLSLGAVFLVVTGGEALYADMGHFGKKPIRITWITVALPCLALNYFGQGALLIANPEAISNPFYELIPKLLLYPLIVLATMATVIASQAVISGVFSITTQAIQLGFSPRFRVVHTSEDEAGQVYLPQINFILMIATIFLVIMFKSSGALAAAYGIAVSMTMIITTILIAYLARTQWKWPTLGVCAFVGFFLPIDLAFFGANAAKFFDGGWFPVVVAIVVFTLLTTWRTGRRLIGVLIRKKHPHAQDLEQLIDEAKALKVDGTAVYLTSNSDGLPPALTNNLKFNKVIHKRILFLTLTTERVPHVASKDRIEIIRDNENFDRAIIRIGFMQNPNIPYYLKKICQSLEIDYESVIYYIGRETLIPKKDFGLSLWRGMLFSFMTRNAQRATTYYQIPHSKVVEIGMQIEI